MALVSGIIALNTKNQYSNFKRVQIKDLKIKLPTQLQYEIGIDQSTSCTGIYIQDTKNIVNILLELEFANKDKKDYFADIFNLMSRLVKGQTVNLIVCERPVPKDVGSYTFRVLTELFGKLEVFLEFNPDLAKTELQSIYPQAWKSRIIDKSKGTGRINTKLCCAEDICDKKPLLKNYLYNSPAKDLDGFDACGILIGYKKCAYTDNGTPKIYGVVEKRHISRVYYRYVDISNVKTQEDFTEAVFGFLGETVSYFQPKLKVYNSDNHYNLLKNIKMASSTYSFSMSNRAIVYIATIFSCDATLAKNISEYTFSDDVLYQICFGVLHNVNLLDYALQGYSAEDLATINKAAQLPGFDLDQMCEDGTPYISLTKVMNFIMNY